jgi:dihydrofolate reductase
MGLIYVDEFVTLDGIAQAPGGPDEDREGGFPFGGWQAPLFDDVVGAALGEGLAELDALLLGRRTYDIFAAYWPQSADGPDAAMGTLFNRVPKYVASRGAPRLDWAGSTMLGPDLPAAVREVRERHEHVHVIGSLDLFRTLLAQRLFDRLSLWVYPVTLGTGKRVFEAGAPPTSLRLLEPPVVSGVGGVLLRYELAPGVPRAGDMTRDDRGT